MPVRAIKQLLKSLKLRDRNKRAAPFLCNHFQSNHASKALLSYIPGPFLKTRSNPTHTNYYEAHVWADCLHELGYQVDICHFQDRLPKSVASTEYDLICGFGEAYEASFQTSPPGSPKRILYSTGCATPFSNRISASRLFELYQQHGYWHPSSIRLSHYVWPMQQYLSDHYFVLGDDFSYQTVNDIALSGQVHSLPCFYLPTLTIPPFDENFEARRKHMLWLGSAGMIHKGLDLAIEGIRVDPEITLHVAGVIPGEIPAYEALLKALKPANTIIPYGFLNAASEEFLNLVRSCGALLFPSASEGCSPSVLTACAAGSLVPIITPNCAVDLDNLQIPIPALTNEMAAQAVSTYLSLSDAELVERSRAVREFVLENYSYERYQQVFKSQLKEVL